MTSQSNRQDFGSVDTKVQSNWTHLAAEFPDLLGDLRSTTIYCLPEALIDAIALDAPRILTTRHLAFERELTNVLSQEHAIGIDAGRLVLSTLFAERSPVVVSRADFEALGWERYGLELEKVNRALETAETRASVFHEQRVAFAGWLITNTQFLNEVAELQKQEYGFWETVSNTEALPYVQGMNDFLNRWQLAGMSSWDLPNPQGPNLSGIESPVLSRRGAESIKVEVPLSMKLPARFDIRELMTEIRSSAGHAHLLEWHQVLNQECKTSRVCMAFFKF
jgi:hypothetical protein